MRQIAVWIMVAACSSIGAARCAGGDGRPNIVFLLTDDQRADALGAAGNPIVQTLQLDQLAARGVRFTNAFVTTSICMTSRASIMLGQYATRHGVNDFSKSLTAQQLEASYFGQLKQAGYRLGFIGKWGVGQPPDGLFDYNRGFPGQGTYYDPSSPDRPHLTRVMTGQAIEFLQGQHDGHPFCLSISFKAPHVQDSARQRPFRFDRTLAGLYQDLSIPPPPLAEPRYFNSLPKFLRDTENRRRWQQRFATAALYQQSVKDYYRLISGVDLAVGRIRKQLQQIGADQNTVIIFSSDNGFFLGERGWAGKWFAHEVSIRVPLIIYDPRQAPEEHRRPDSHMVLNLDLAPTILDYAGLKPPAWMQGRSLKPRVDGQSPADWRSEFFYEHHFRHPGIPRSEGVRTERWKYIRYLDSQPLFEELYDLKADPDEQHNLAQDPSHSQVLAQMQQSWRRLRRAAR